MRWSEEDYEKYKQDKSTKDKKKIVKSKYNNIKTKNRWDCI